MSAAIKAIFEFDTSKAESDLGRLVVISNEATRRMAASFNRRIQESGQSAIPENMGGAKMAAVSAETGKQFGKGFGIAGGAMVAPMFFSVLRDSFASLASGAPISQIIGQQAPQVLQAFTMMGAKVMRLLGPVGLAIGALFGARWLGGKFGEAIYGGEHDFDKQNESLIRRKEKYQELRKEAVELAKAEKELSDQRAKEKSAGYDSYKDLSNLMFENRIKNNPNKTAAHKERMEYLRTDLALAKSEMESSKRFQFNENPAISVKYTKAAIRLENAKQSIIDAEKEFSETQTPQASLSVQVTDRQRIGAFSNNSIQVSILDVNKAQEKHLRAMRNAMERDNGSF